MIKPSSEKNDKNNERSILVPILSIVLFLTSLSMIIVKIQQRKSSRRRINTVDEESNIEEFEELPLEKPDLGERRVSSDSIPPNMEGKEIVMIQMEEGKDDEVSTLAGTTAVVVPPQAMPPPQPSIHYLPLFRKQLSLSSFRKQQQKQEQQQQKQEQQQGQQEPVVVVQDDKTAASSVFRSYQFWKLLGKDDNTMDGNKSVNTANVVEPACGFWNLFDNSLMKKTGKNNSDDEEINNNSSKDPKKLEDNKSYCGSKSMMSQFFPHYFGNDQKMTGGKGINSSSGVNNNNKNQRTDGDNKSGNATNNDIVSESSNKIEHNIVPAPDKHSQTECQDDCKINTGGDDFYVTVQDILEQQQHHNLEQQEQHNTGKYSNNHKTDNYNTSTGRRWQKQQQQQHNNNNSTSTGRWQKQQHNNNNNKNGYYSAESEEYDVTRTVGDSYACPSKVVQHVESSDNHHNNNTLEQQQHKNTSYNTEKHNDETTGIDYRTTGWWQQQQRNNNNNSSKTNNNNKNEYNNAEEDDVRSMYDSYACPSEVVAHNQCSI